MTFSIAFYRFEKAFDRPSTTYAIVLRSSSIAVRSPVSHPPTPPQRSKARHWALTGPRASPGGGELLAISWILGS
jgi:hypothetical protein